MATEAEKYFLDQLASQLASPSEVVATGYFHTFIRDRWLLNALTIFADVARTRGHFLALTNDRLLVVKTRAPAATSSPLLENKGVVAIPLSGIRKVTIDTDLFLIESDVETLALQLQVTNKAFPSQGRLLEQFAARFNLSESVASIRAAQAKKRWFKVGMFAATIVAGVVLWEMFKNGN